MRTPAPRLALQFLALAATAAACAPATTQGNRTGSAAVVTAEDIARYPNETLARILERSVPGLEAIRTPAGGTALRIRGVSAIDGTPRPPLYVLNGSPIASGPYGEVPNINPVDIATITVLRGPDTAMYGVDGANGVIEITTKRGPSQ